MPLLSLKSMNPWPALNGVKMEKRDTPTIYLDHNATTPIAPEVVEAMMPYLKEEFGNPSSGYGLGTKAKKAIETARKEVAALLGSKNEEIVFTSGGSESNNAVLKGVIDFRAPEKFHIITSSVEHPAVLNPCLYLMEIGVEVTFVSVDHFGVVNPEEIEKAIKSSTVLVSIMAANNETGTLQPIEEITRVAHGHGVMVHTDAAQAVGKLEVDVESLGVDFLSLAGHKFYGPKGVGALYVREGRAITPLIHGAAQEGGKRAGTENLLLVAGLGAACRICRERLTREFKNMKMLRDRLETLLFEGLDHLVLNGHPQHRLPNTLNVSVPGLEGGKILAGVPEIMASTGAACHDRSVRLSHVLAAMGVASEVGMGALRLTVGRSNSLAQVEEAARLIVNQVKRMQDDR